MTGGVTRPILGPGILGPELCILSIASRIIGVGSSSFQPREPLDDLGVRPPYTQPDLATGPDLPKTEQKEQVECSRHDPS